MDLYFMSLQELIPPRMVEPGYNMSVIEGDRFELGCHVSAAKRKNIFCQTPVIVKVQATRS